MTTALLSSNSHIPGVSKTQRYGWGKAEAQGVHQWIPKDTLLIDHTYQRPLSNLRANQIASKWSWSACGSLLVGLRQSGEAFVVEGQHRHAAAMKRDDISDLPCMVFESTGPEMEAEIWAKANTARKNPTSVEKYYAALAYKDPLAQYLDSVLTKHGIHVKDSGKVPMTVRSLGMLLELAGDDKPRFERVISLAAVLCASAPITDRLVGGLYYLDKNGCGIEDPRFTNKIRMMGIDVLTEKIKRVGNMQGNFGRQVCAKGILDAVNTNLKNRFTCRFITED